MKKKEGLDLLVSFKRSTKFKIAHPPMNILYFEKNMLIKNMKKNIGTDFNVSLAQRETILSNKGQINIF